MASVCSIWTCAVIGALGACASGARADVIVTCEIRLDTEISQLVGVEERVFDPDVLYASPSQIQTMALFLIVGPAPERFLSGYIVDEELTQVPSLAKAMEIEALELDWQDLSFETAGTGVDVPALIQWGDEQQDHPPALNQIKHVPAGSIQFLSPVTTLGVGFTG